MQPGGGLVNHLLTRVRRLKQTRPHREAIRTPEDHAALCSSLGISPDWLVLGDPERGYLLLPPEVEP